MGSHKHKVSYFYDPDIGNFYYGQGHPMKPHRVRMAHDLILRYDLYNHMDVFRPVPATVDDLNMFHSEDYVSFLSTITVDEQDKFKKELERYNLTQDCPIFDGIFNYCQIYTGGSIGGAIKLNYQDSDIVINWAGGLHHAKKSEASGFCYINDIVLAILELLKHHQRVLYLDIDVHHGDGVEEAFLTTDRVMTVSFHKYGDNYFPGTGNTDNIGHGKGLHYSLNVPLSDGIDDQSYFMLFKPIMQKVMEVYQPEVIVLQSGADSLAGDRLGVFNLSIRAHAECHRFMKAFGVPMLVLGGGGYKIKNVARCWTYETGVLLGVEDSMSNQLPPNEYYEYYGPDYQLHIGIDDKQNLNDQHKLMDIRDKILDSLSKARPSGVAFHEPPPDAMTLEQINGGAGRED